MKKTITLLIFILTFSCVPSPAQETPEQTLDRIILQLEELREMLAEPSEPLTDLTASFVSENIIQVTWQPVGSGEIDLEYYIPGLHDEWQHSVADYVDSLSVAAGSARIGVQRSGAWLVRATRGEWTSESVQVSSAGQDPEHKIPPFSGVAGLWDSWNYQGDSFSLVKLPGLQPYDASMDTGVEMIVSVSHRWKGKSRSEWDAMMDWMSRVISSYPPGRTYILIQDEPLSNHHGFTDDEVRYLYEGFKGLLPDYRFGFSFTRKSVRQRIEEGLKTDFVILPLYLFSGETTKADFDSYFDEHVAIARQKLQTDEIFVLGQGFYNRPGSPRDWTEPPIEAALWYAEAIYRNNLQGIVFWVYRSNEDVFGLDQMPDYFREIIQVFAGRP